MGCDCKVKLKGRVTSEAIVDFISKQFSVSVDSEISKTEDDFAKDFAKEVSNKNKDSLFSLKGCLWFKCKGVPMAIYYLYNNYNCYENLEYYEPLGLENMVKSETTTLIARTSPEAVKLMKAIVSHFGGWIDENDCDNEPYYYVEGKGSSEKTPDRAIRSCPFCGSSAVYITEREEPLTGVIIPQFFCNACKVIIEVENDSPYMNDGKTYKYLKEKLEKTVFRNK